MEMRWNGRLVPVLLCKSVQVLTLAESAASRRLPPSMTTSSSWTKMSSKLWESQMSLLGWSMYRAVESGIALQLKFGPLLAHTAEMEPTVQKIMDELLEDLLVWLEIYEQLAVNGVTVTSTFGDPMPKNKAAGTSRMILDIWTQADWRAPGCRLVV
jgi:hypothetical protein